MQKERAALVLPSSAEVTKQVAQGGHSITFLQVALGILERLGKLVHTSYKDEIRFLEDCLHAGPAQTQLPCDLVSDGNEAEKTVKVKSDVRVGYCETVLRRGSTKSTDTVTQTVKEKPPALQRKDSALRGSLTASKVPTLDEASGANLSKKGVPWLGGPVSQWPRRPSRSMKPHTASKVQKLFDEQFNDWTLDIFAVAAATARQPLVYVGWEALRRCGCFSEFCFNPEKVSAFLEAVESRYASETQTAYHNNVHAADVTQSLWALLWDVGGGSYFDPMDTAVGVLGAIIHDMGHDGRTNAFHSNVQDKLALRYNDKSILENFHVSSAFKLFVVDKSSNFIADLPKPQQVIFRRECIDMVLGTDMALHFKMLGEFREHIAKLGMDVAEWFGNEAAMYNLRSIILHSADISNQAKPMRVAQQWTYRVLTEFFAQGDAERKLGLPVSPLCDRKTVDISDSQAGFIEFIVRPSFELIASLVPRANPVCVSQTIANYQAWKEGRGYSMDFDPTSSVDIVQVGVEAALLSDGSDDVPETPLVSPKAATAVSVRRNIGAKAGSVCHPPAPKYMQPVQNKVSATISYV